MALAFVITNALIVIVDSQLSVLTAWKEMLSFWGQVNRVQFLVRSFDRTDDCAVVFLPVSYFSVRTCCENLVLLTVKKGLLEGGWFEKTEKSCVGFKVPNDAWTIAAGWNGLRIVLVDLDWPNSASVFFKWGFHDLGLLWNFPDSNFTFSTTWNDSCTIWSCCYCCASVIVGIIDDIK